MNNFEEQLKNVARHTMLNPERKKEIRANLLRFIEVSEIVRAHDAGRQISQSKNSVLSFLTKPMSILLTLALLLGVGGGTSFAAEQALPGDILYPIKVDFNEKVAAAFSVNAEARAQLEAKFAERRLEEASKLASEDRLSANAQTELSARFGAHSKETKTKINKLETSGDANGAANVASEFEASLRAHQAILLRLSALNATSSEDSRELDDNLSGEISSATQLRVELEGRIAERKNSAEVKTSAEGRLGAATNVIAAARNYIKNRKSRLSIGAAAQAEVELKATDQLVIDGQAKIDAGFYGEAFNLANAAIRKAQEARVLVRAQDNLNFEINFRGDEKGYDKDGDKRSDKSASSSLNLEEDFRATSSNGRDDSKPPSGNLKVEDSEKSGVNINSGSGNLDSSGSAGIKIDL
ncbi:MAG: DUF5667 domain-containing protein [bacterium]|nr:DUF5667 domain-containing protein [bacterium]